MKLYNYRILWTWYNLQHKATKYQKSRVIDRFHPERFLLLAPCPGALVHLLRGGREYFLTPCWPMCPIVPFFEVPFFYIPKKKGKKLSSLCIYTVLSSKARSKAFFFNSPEWQPLSFIAPAVFFVTFSKQNPALYSGRRARVPNVRVNYKQSNSRHWRQFRLTHHLFNHRILLLLLLLLQLLLLLIIIILLLNPLKANNIFDYIDNQVTSCLTGKLKPNPYPPGQAANICKILAHTLSLSLGF